VSALLPTADVLDRVGTPVGVLVVAWLVLGLARRRIETEPPPLSRRAELGWLAGIVAVAAVCRLAGLSENFTPAYWDAASNTVMVDQMLKGPGFVAILRSLALEFQGHSYFTNFRLLLPMATVVQRTLGPSFELQAYLGAMFGLTGIILAWLLGRLYRGPLFGLLFAACLSTSLIQLLWSRIGGPYLSGVPHILAVCILGFEAGRRNNVVFALLAGVLASLCLYTHYQARVCFPLAYVAVLAGAARRPRPLGPIVVQGVVVTAAIVGMLAYLSPGHLLAPIWPNMGGDVGNQGETSVAELVQKNWAPSVARFWECLHLLFVDHRGSRDEWGWGLERGGMILEVTIALGAIALVASVVQPTRDVLPLAITGLGFAIAILSEAQSRKLIVFDMGWQLLAAVGLYEVLRRVPVRRLRALVLGGAVAYVFTATWSFAALAVTTLRAGMLEIPFRQFVLPLFGDAFDAPRTLPVARRWADWMRQDHAVVFMNTDNFATNFATYGAIAELDAGRDGYFFPYHLLDSSAGLPSDHLSQVISRPSPFPQSLAEAIRTTGARGVVFWFERPTQWDEWLIRELAARGGSVERWPTAAFDERWGAPSASVVVEEAALDTVLAAFGALDVARDGRGDVCLSLAPTEQRVPPSPSVSTVMRVMPPGGPARWVFVATEGVFDGPDPLPGIGRAVGVAAVAGGLAMMDQQGNETTLDVADGLRIRSATPRVQVGDHSVGASCAARVGDDWWLVDPVRGTVLSNQPTDWIPARPWVGLTADGSGRLLLAAADQHVVVVRPETRRVEREFPARIWPSFRLQDFGSCTALRMLGGYVASFGLSDGLLALYSPAGKPHANVRMAEALPDLAELGPIAVDVSGSSLLFTEVLLPMTKVFSYEISAGRAGCKSGVRIRTSVPPSSKPARATE
jgi:hypothetical protein